MHFYDGWSFIARSAAMSHIALNHVNQLVESNCLGDFTLIASALSCLMFPLAILSRMLSIITGRDLPLTKTLSRH